MLLLQACSAAALPADNLNPSTPSPVMSVVPQPGAPGSADPATLLPAALPTVLSEVPTLVITASPVVPTEAPTRQGPGKILCPILLYHHIATPKQDNPYYVTPTEFREQMQALKDWGYTAISINLLVKAINFGAVLPARPVVITFDDGDVSVYEQAFPVMREFGFRGVTYLVVNYVGAAGYMNVEQLKELAAANWEMGSHSMTHSDLTASTRVEWEVVQSRHSLEKLLGVAVMTFAYPYGKKDVDIQRLVRENYRAGLGLGNYLEQGPNNIFYLWRRPVLTGWDVKTFGSFLPWNAPP